MQFIKQTINDARVIHIARRHARLGLEPAQDRVLEAVLGPAIAVPEDDFEVKRASRAAQRSRETIDDLDTVVAGAPGGDEPPNRAQVPPYVFLLIALACALTDFAGSELTAYMAGTPSRQLIFVALSFTSGALLITTGVATAIEHAWKRGGAGHVGAILLGVVYVVCLLLVASSRFAPIDEDVNAVEILGGGLMALFCVGGPALGAHLALRAWLKARPAALAEHATITNRKKAERELDRAHGVLSTAQRAGREREAERTRLRSLYLTTHREEAARLAQLDRKSPNPNQEN